MKAADFAGKLVYLTGGSMGIGLAIAKRASGLGAHVVHFARRLESLESATEAMRAARRTDTQRIAHFQLDVSDPRAVAETMTTAVSALGAPDVLINCAGRAYPRYFEDVSHEQFAETMQVNLHGCWNTISALAPHMKARRAGYIVNTASLAGLIGMFGYTDYCASKFAIIGFSEALRSELKPSGITVSVLCPPDTDTPGFAVENQTKPRETKVLSGNTKVMSPEAVADALFAGMARGPLLIIPGRDNRLVFLLKRLFPGVIERAMDRTVSRVQARK